MQATNILNNNDNKIILNPEPNVGFNTSSAKFYEEGRIIPNREPSISIRNVNK